MDPSSFGEVSSPTGSIHFVDLNIFRSSCGFVHFCGVDRVFGSVYFVDYLEFLPSRGSVHFVNQKFQPFGDVSPSRGFVHSVVLLHIYFLEGPSTLRTKILEPLVRFRPLRGPSTLWTCHIFYPLEGPSTLRTKILEPLVRSRPLRGPSTLWTCHIFYPLEGLSTFGLSSFSPFRRSIHPMCWIEFSLSMGSVLLVYQLEF